MRSLLIRLASDDLMRLLAVHQSFSREGGAATRALTRRRGVVDSDALHVALDQTALTPLTVLVKQSVAGAALDVLGVRVRAPFRAFSTKARSPWCTHTHTTRGGKERKRFTHSSGATTKRFTPIDDATCSCEARTHSNDGAWRRRYVSGGAMTINASSEAIRASSAEGDEGPPRHGTTRELVSRLREASDVDFVVRMTRCFVVFATSRESQPRGCRKSPCQPPT